MKSAKLILASSSRHRRAQLEQHGFKVLQITPSTEEAERTGETPQDRALRLGIAKAVSVREQLMEPGPTLILGSDQVCHMGGDIYHKRGSPGAAARHLANFSGRWVTFSTSLTALAHDGRRIDALEEYHLKFRELSSAEIDEYIALDNPNDCAGAIKLEKFGLSLMDDVRGRDSTSVYGLPMMSFYEAARTLRYPISNFIKKQYLSDL